MEEISDILKSVPSEFYIERLIGDIDVERLDGTIEYDIALYRKEKFADPDDIESVYEREYVAIKDGDVDEEIFLGNDKGDTITIKEKENNMSKMSELHMELEEYACDGLGFNSLDEALKNGYEIDYENHSLVRTPTDNEQGKAHLSEKEEQLNRLDGVIAYLKGNDDPVAKYMIRELEETERYIKERV